MLRFREFVENYDELDERAWTPAQRQARKDVGKKISKGRAKSDLSAAQKGSLEKRLDRIAGRISNLGKRMRKDKRKQELQRKRGK